MIGRLLTKQYELNGLTVTRNLDGITHKESLQQPAPLGNCINWILGHMLLGRNSIHRLLGLRPAWEAETCDRYQRGSPPLADTDQAEPLEKLLEQWRTSQQAVVDALTSARDQELSDTTGDDPLGIQLAFLAFHESYHAGQLGLLRRLAGRDGGIP
jgi:uncharacterized damage-inducible protein DinB